MVQTKQYFHNGRRQNDKKVIIFCIKVNKIQQENSKNQKVTYRNYVIK